VNNVRGDILWGDTVHYDVTPDPASSMDPERSDV